MLTCDKLQLIGALVYFRVHIVVPDFILPNFGNFLNKTSGINVEPSKSKVLRLLEVAFGGPGRVMEGDGR